MASGQGGNQRRRRLPSGWEDIPMRNVSPTQHTSDRAQRALFPVPNLNNSPPGILQGSQHSGSISSPNLSPLALSPQAAGANNSPQRNPGAFNGSPPIFAFDVYAPNPVRRPDDVFHPQYSPPARAAIASSSYDTSPNHLSPSTAAGSAGYGTPALGATGSSPYTTTPGSYYSPVEAMRGSGPLDNAGAYGGQYSAVGAIGGQYSAVGAIGGQFPAGSGSRPTRHRRVPSSANLTHLVAGLEQNPGPVHFNFPDVNALANPGLYGGQQLQLSPPSPIQRLNTAQPFVQPMSPLYENQFSPGVRRYSDRSSVGSQIGSAGSLFNNSPLNSPGSGGSNMGLAGSIGGPAGSIGGSAGSIGGPAGSIGGSAGSIGGSAGSIGGSAGSFGGSSGMGSMSPIPSFSSGSGRGASSGSEHYEER